MKKLLIILLLAFIAGSEAGAQNGASPDDTARYLAGLPVRGTALEPFAGTPEWLEHATFFDDAWAKLEQRQLGPVRQWASE